MKNLYAVSIVAMKHKEDGWAVDHDAFVTISSSHEYAKQAVLENAFKQWPLTEGWVGHVAHSVLIDRSSAMEIHTKLSEESSDGNEESTEFIM